jgi:DNA-binding IclR family transcriptional regulator
MADAARTTVVAEAHAVIQRLSDAVKETVDLSVLDRGAAVFLDQVVSAQRLRAVSSVGASFPLHCTANGKAMLAQLPPSKLEEALSDDFEAYTANTITSPGALRRELQEIRKLGVAIDREEHSHGVSAIGVCIGLTPLGYMAISIPIPTQRFEDKQALATELIGHAAAEVRSLFDA